MATLNRGIFDSIKATGAHVFTGLGSEFARLPRVGRNKKQSEIMKADVALRFDSGEGPAASCLGKRQLQDAEDDRWLQVEGGSPLRWRSCTICAFLNPADRAVCEECGTPALGQTQDECSARLRLVADDQQGDAGVLSSPILDSQPKGQRKLSLQEIVVASGRQDDAETINATRDTDRRLSLSEVVVEHGNHRQYSTSASSPSEEEGKSNMVACDSDSDEASDDDLDRSSEYEKISGTLDEAPPAGTQVKVLYDDDIWHPAKVVAASGAIGIVVYANGERDELDFEDVAVRLADYSSDDSSDDEKIEVEHNREEDFVAHENASSEPSRVEDAAAPEDALGQSRADEAASTEEVSLNSGTPLQLDERPNDQMHRVDESSDSEEEMEEEIIPGTLDTPPPVGTQVKVLHDDDIWHLARVVSARDAIAFVVYEDGERDELDLDEVAVRLADYMSDDESDEAVDKAVKSKEKSDDESDHRLTEQAESDDESEYEDIPGTLDEAPPVGTRVKVLLDDDAWHTAQITASSGSKARLLFEFGEQEDVDLDLVAVRPIDYVSDDEECDDAMAYEDTSADTPTTDACAQQLRCRHSGHLREGGHASEADESLPHATCFGRSSGSL